jgi:hypothetical protein
MCPVQDRLMPRLPLWKLEMQLEQAIRVEARLRAEHTQAKRHVEDLRLAIAMRRNESAQTLARLVQS